MQRGTFLYVAAGNTMALVGSCAFDGGVVQPYESSAPDGGPVTLKVLINGDTVGTLTKQ